MAVMGCEEAVDLSGNGSAPASAVAREAIPKHKPAVPPPDEYAQALHKALQFFNAQRDADPASSRARSQDEQPEAGLVRGSLHAPLGRRPLRSSLRSAPLPARGVEDAGSPRFSPLSQPTGSPAASSLPPLARLMCL